MAKKQDDEIGVDIIDGPLAPWTTLYVRYKLSKTPRLNLSISTENLDLEAAYVEKQEITGKIISPSI